MQTILRGTGGLNNNNNQNNSNIIGLYCSVQFPWIYRLQSVATEKIRRVDSYLKQTIILIIESFFSSSSPSSFFTSIVRLGTTVLGGIQDDLHFPQ